MPLYMTVEKRLTIELHLGSEYVAWDHHVMRLVDLTWPPQTYSMTIA